MQKMETKTLSEVDAECKSLIASIIKYIMQAINLQRIQNLISQNIKKKYGIGMEELELKFNMNFVQDPEKIAFLQEYAFENIKGMTDEIAERLRKELTESIMNLESVPQLASRIKDVMNISKERAILIARTESARAENEGKMDSARQTGLKLTKYWDGTKDTRRCEYCKAMEDKYDENNTIPLDSKFKLNLNGKDFEVVQAPLHPRCRCSVFFKQED